MAVEPPPLYTIAFKNGEKVKYRIDKSTIGQIAEDMQQQKKTSAYDVEASDGTFRKLVFRYEDILYIG